jgi:hypothetical protein
MMLRAHRGSLRQERHPTVQSCRASVRDLVGCPRRVSNWMWTSARCRFKARAHAPRFALSGLKPTHGQPTSRTR